MKSATPMFSAHSPQPDDRSSTLPSEDVMYRALLEKDSTFDGVFFIGVRTTGIFCRPVCTAKKPRRENVTFFATARDALHAGFRACKVCRPMDGGQRPPDWVGQLLQRVDASPAHRLQDADLRDMGIEPSRARRYFQSKYGMTFHAYCRARRLGSALGAIRRSSQQNGISHAPTGYESESGFREAFARLFGKPPGKASDIHLLTARWIDTPLGAMLALACDKGLCLLEFVDRRMIEKQIARIRKRFDAVIVPGAHAHLDAIDQQLREYFEGRRKQFTVPLAQRGPDFHMQVWRELLKIPCGQTVSYSDIAMAIGRPGSQRAVGRANGDNPIAIVVPCHRVVRSDGTLCGYGGGLWRKRRLLELEQGLPSRS